MPSLSAVSAEFREYRGKRFVCLYSGHYSTSGYSCGTDDYAEVFTGTVQSVSDLGDADKRLILIPDEVFAGDQRGEVSAVTNQACLHSDIEAGQKWLVYLHRRENSKELVLEYYSPSKPLEKAQREIATLRHLSKMTDLGLITGSAGDSGHQVIATRVSDGAEYKTTSDSHDRYEFELPPGNYRLTANTQRGMWAPETQIRISKKGCVDFNFWLHTDGRIAGTVTEGNGKPARFVQVAIVPVSPAASSFTVIADGNGHYEVGGRLPGKYLVGVGLLAEQGSAEWQSRTYYPGVPAQEQAKPIDLGKGEWRTDIDFKLLRNPVANN